MKNTHKTVLVLGITGGYGRSMARELLQRGYSLQALVRDCARGAAAVADLPGPVRLFEGDILDRAALSNAAAGVDFIVHGVNPSYDRWDPFVVDACTAVAEAAVATGACIVFPGNVYNFSPGLSLTETTPQVPPTRKGAIRVDAERVLAQATERGARLIVLRGGDFFGVGHPSAWTHTLLGHAAKGGRIIYPTAHSVLHQWAFLPDFARAHADLMDQASSLAPAATFHFEGHVVTGAQWLQAVREALGAPTRKSMGLPWWALRIAGLFVPVMRELVAMRYLWDEEVVMSGDALRQTLGTVPHTPLVEALRAELRAHGAEVQEPATLSRLPARAA